MKIETQNLSDPEKLLWDFGVVSPDQIDLEAIAWDQGAEVLYRDLEGCEARLVASGDRAIISLSNSSNPGRQRFSLGHELAHWIWDRSREDFLCASSDISPQNDESKSTEALANGRASQLVLPDYLVVPWQGHRSTTLTLANELNLEFRTSLTAAAIKLSRLSTDPICLVCHGQTTRKWFSRSKTFPTDLWPVKELHCETDAFRLTFQTAQGITKAQKATGDRWIEGPGVHRLDCTAQSVWLADGVVLTLLAIT